MLYEVLVNRTPVTDQPAILRYATHKIQHSKPDFKYQRLAGLYQAKPLEDLKQSEEKK